jgi:hypothetical protein
MDERNGQYNTNFLDIVILWTRCTPIKTISSSTRGVKILNLPRIIAGQQTFIKYHAQKRNYDDEDLYKDAIIDLGQKQSQIATSEPRYASVGASFDHSLK